MPKLELIHGGGNSQSWLLDGNELIIGRQADCDVVLAETAVSRSHARISRRSDGFWLEDLGSRNGTTLNGKRLAQATLLSDGDAVQIHDFVLRYHDDNDVFPEFSLEDFQGDSAFSRAHDPLLATHSELAAFTDSDSHDPPSAVVTAVGVRPGFAHRSEINARQKLEAVLEIARGVGSSLDAHQLLPKILRSLLRIFVQARRGCILLAENADGPLIPQAAIGRRQGDVSSRRGMLSRTVVARVLEQGQAVLSYDVANDSRFMASRSVADLNIGAVMCAPLIGPSHRPLGVMQLDADLADHEFTENDLEVLASIASLAAQMLEHARLHEKHVAAERRERDIVLARDVQLHFLPRNPPALPGYQFVDYYRAALGIGGDYFGYIPLPGGKLAVAMGDVSGKGVSAALLMARFSSDVRYVVATSKKPAAAIHALNQCLDADVLCGRFITFVLCVIDPRRHEMLVVNAGHIPPLIRRAASGQIETMDINRSGPPLGVSPDWIYEETRVALAPGDMVLLMTDGVTESSNTSGHAYGMERASRALTSPDAQQNVDALLLDLEQFSRDTPTHDDACVVCFGRTQ